MSSKRNCSLSLQQIIELVNEEDLDGNDIYVEPPDPNIDTDESSGPEDESGPGNLDHLSGRQLRAGAEFILSDGTRIGDIEEEPIDVSLDSAVPEITSPTVATAAPTQGVVISVDNKRRIKWINGDLEKNLLPIQQRNPQTYMNSHCFEMFELFFDDDILNFLVAESSKYAIFKNCPDPKIKIEEMRCFLGILICSGYDVKPGLRYYWDSSSDMKNEMVSMAMRRDRFIQIMRFLHCADNATMSDTDKVWKVRPLMDKLKDKYMKEFVPEQSLDYDESMVKYYGRHGCKQFIRGKPIRFGYKMWCLNSASGYLINFDMYQGKNPRGIAQYETGCGKATAPLLLFLDELPEEKKDLPYEIFFDNLFTSVNLLLTLRERGYCGTGTVRENRIPRSCPLPTKKEVMKKERGTYISKIDQTDGIMFIKWKDNGVVTIASNSHGVEPTQMVSRYSKEQKRPVRVPMPYAMKLYNLSMGGTDLMDENMSRYRVSIRGKKWWWCIFTWLLDTAIQNSWLLLRRNGKKMSQLDFRREVAQHYMTKYATTPKGAGRPSTSHSSTDARIPDYLRYDRIDHLVVSTPEKKRRRCAGEGCCSSGRTMCGKCNVGLCLECFKPFHQK